MRERKMIPIASIKIGPRKRQVEPEKIAELAESIQASGYIKVNERKESLYRR